MTPYGEYTMQEFKTLELIGMNTSEIIKAATLTAAEALGMEHRIGTIEEEKLADMLILTADPTESAEVLYDASNIKYVIQGGRVVVEDGSIKY